MHASLVAARYEEPGLALGAAGVLERGDLLDAEVGALAVLARDASGVHHVISPRRDIVRAERWGMFWGLLFGAVFFVPDFGLAREGSLGLIYRKLEAAGVDARVQQRLRELLAPGSCALFLAVAESALERALAALGAADGAVLHAALLLPSEAELQAALLAG